MKMVASSKLHHAQQNIEQMRPYEKQLKAMMTTFVAALEGDISSPYAQQREVKRVALVVFTSNSSLCGGFNGNAIKAMRRLMDDYRAKSIEVARIIPIGKKVVEAVRKQQYEVPNDLSEVLDHPTYAPIAALAQELMQQFVAGEIDKVDILFHHFKSAGSQILTTEQFLPILFDQEHRANINHNFIIEPNAQRLLTALVPKALYLKLYSAMLNSLASEHAARVIAMQVATDNADDLLRELTLQYNKSRQQAITAELLDIIGGSMQ